MSHSVPEREARRIEEKRREERRRALFVLSESRVFFCGYLIEEEQEESRAFKTRVVLEVIRDMIRSWLLRRGGQM